VANDLVPGAPLEAGARLKVARSEAWRPAR